ncbi:hypothetical protein HJC23_000784 [Cyclotella cryptica]|uniref:sn-1-specific diacylglycerol lipase n=1 Tax=Cyclotella cryptica TaxID=29204 RepID=A0ABD3PYZ7_9STRA|eukprot:CCRYP_010164-RA/>CCRYP_010164-RA protein AED:0.06 eAED:0.06 QI:165/1/1/1/0.5/0.55/9/1505/862
MPALQVYERLLVAGDDLRLTTTLLVLFRLFQSALLIIILYNLYTYDHNPDIFLHAGCVTHIDNYWMWYHSSIAACYSVLAYSIVGAFVEGAIWKISGMGTPTETERRRKLVPLCKCLFAPMFVVRSAGFVFGVYIIGLTRGYCECVKEELMNSLDDMQIARSFCPNYRQWFDLVKILIVTMGVDLICHIIIACYILRKRFRRWYDRKRMPKERSAREKSWESTCRRCCECSSIMTCYIFGGRNLTRGGYVDVAIALTDFLDDGGSLDIVPSDIAAALICLVNIQKQKQIECKNELLKDTSGMFAKDKVFSTRILKLFRETNSRSTHNASINSVRSNSMRGASSLQQLKSISEHSYEYDDIEQGFGGPLEMRTSMDENDLPDTRLADDEIQKLQKFMSLNETLAKISFRLVHHKRGIDFRPQLPKILSPNNEYDRLIIGEGARLCRVALAAYSWMLYVWTNKCTGCCVLTGGTLYNACRCKLRQCSKNENIIGDNWCGWKHSAVMKSLGIDESDVLYANFQNGIGVNPYMVIVDRAWKTVVVAIRGTLSLEDMITDVTLSPQSLEEVGEQCGFDGSGEHCHNGILAGARRIYDDLARNKILDQAISHEFSGFKLRIIGHSLGGGIAAMLGLMLRQKFPTLRCLCFSPPGCVFSERTAQESKNYACTYVLHNDVVPRLSYESMINLRNDIIEMIARIKVPKYKVFNANLMPGSEKEVCDKVGKHLHKEDHIPQSKFWNEFNDYKARQQEHTSSSVSPFKMTLPGRIVQMVRTSEKLSNNPCSCVLSCVKCTACCGMSINTKKYKVKWSDKEDLSEIFISPSMLVDHFPYNIARALECAARSYDIPLNQGRDAIFELSRARKPKH